MILGVLNFSEIRHVLIIDTYGKGAFAISGDVKVKKGAICSLKRNEDSIHGNCQMHDT
jgi:hypothetical protein